MIFPEREMTILDYNRVIKDLNGRSAEQFLAELRKRFHSYRVGYAGTPGLRARIRNVSLTVAGTG